MTSTRSDASIEDHGLRQLLRNGTARGLILRVLLTRVATSGFGTAVATLVAIEPFITIGPGWDAGLTGLAALGIISASGAAAALISNGVGQRLVERFGVRRTLGVAAAAQAALAITTATLIATVGLVGSGLLGLTLLTFAFAVTTPGISALARGWWFVVGLPEPLARRGGVLEPTLSAAAWVVGPALAAPLVLLSPWVVAGFAASAVAGWLLLGGLPNLQVSAKRRVAIGKLDGLTDWWMSLSYSLYHVARALLGAGSTAVLVGAGQPGLVGAASSAPSAGHIIGGLAFASRKDPDRNLLGAVWRGLVGQGAPTLLLVVAFALWPQPGVIAAGALLVGGGALIGILKAPVASAVYPLAEATRPHLSPGSSAAVMTQGITIGGFVGPLLGTFIISTVGAVWLLPASVLALGLCGLGITADERVTRSARLRGVDLAGAQ